MNLSHGTIAKHSRQRPGFMLAGIRIPTAQALNFVLKTDINRNDKHHFELSPPRCCQDLLHGRLPIRQAPLA